MEESNLQNEGQKEQANAEPKVEQTKVEQKVQQPKGPGIFSKIKGKLSGTISGYKRVLEVSRKPTKEDFTSESKVALTGIALLGSIGFIIFLAYFLVI